MDFAHPYRAITPTLEGPILRVLADVTAPLTRGQISEVAGDVSEAGVRKALARLVEQGIVVEQRFGRRYVYVANRHHLLWPSIGGLLSGQDLLRQHVAEQVAGWDLPPLSVELFGSVVRGGSDAGSDIDLLIVRPDLEPAQEEIWDAQVAELHDQVALRTGNACDVVVLGPGELERAHNDDEPILRPPTINLVGTPLAVLLTRANGSLDRSAQLIAENTAMTLHLEELSRLVAALAADQEKVRMLSVAIEARTDGAGPLAEALHGNLAALGPVLELDVPALRTAVRILDHTARVINTYEDSEAIGGPSL